MKEVTREIPDELRDAIRLIRSVCEKQPKCDYHCPVFDPEEWECGVSDHPCVWNPDWSDTVALYDEGEEPN